MMALIFRHALFFRLHFQPRFNGTDLTSYAGSQRVDLQEAFGDGVL